jgi:hypothetical protein
MKSKTNRLILLLLLYAAMLSYRLAFCETLISIPFLQKHFSYVPCSYAIINPLRAQGYVEIIKSYLRTIHYRRFDGTHYDSTRIAIDDIYSMGCDSLVVFTDVGICERTKNSQKMYYINKMTKRVLYMGTVATDTPISYFYPEIDSNGEPVPKIN